MEDETVILAIAVELHSAFGAIEILEALHFARAEGGQTRKDTTGKKKSPSQLISDIEVDVWTVQNAPRFCRPIIHLPQHPV